MYSISGTVSSDSTGYIFSNDSEVKNYFELVIADEHLDFNNCNTTEVKEIGKYKLPYKLTVEYEIECKDVICATCRDLEIVSCAANPTDAFEGLETELKDAIELYVHLLKESELDDLALQYRRKLYEIERLNSQ